MVWSPRRLAELAGTSRRAVRHYHDIGLLPAPERQRNGYQQYGVDHLLRLLRIRRLTQLGLTLPQIAAVGDTDRPPDHVLRDLDADLTRDIERLQQTRSELAAMLGHAGPVDLPAEVTRRVEGLPAAERALVVVLTRLLGPPALEAYLALLPPYRADAAVIAFDDLPDAADEPSRVVVANGIAEHLHRLSTHRPDQLQDIDTDLRRAALTRRTIGQAITNLYNPAQLDVLTRARRLGGTPRRSSSDDRATS